MLWELVRWFHLTHGTLETCFTIKTVKLLHQQKVNHSCWNLDVFGILIFLFCIDKSYNLEESLSELCLSVASSSIVIQYSSTKRIPLRLSLAMMQCPVLWHGQGLLSVEVSLSLKGFDIIDALYLLRLLAYIVISCLTYPRFLQISQIQSHLWLLEIIFYLQFNCTTCSEF